MSGDGGSEPLSSGIGILACRMLHAEVDKHIHVLLYAAAYDALGRSLLEDVLHEMHTNLSQCLLEPLVWSRQHDSIHA